MRHSAVLLAGGKSTRMGRDKSELLVAGVPLWRRQLEVLKATEPEQMMISGPIDAPHASAAECVIIPDRAPGCGPLAGIAATLEACHSDWLLTLAVDMPAMDAAYLRSLVGEALRWGRGVIPRHANDQWEPLAAVYPRAAWGLATDLLAAGERRLSVLVDVLVREGTAQPRIITPEEERYFINWNSPEDMAGY